MRSRRWPGRAGATLILAMFFVLLLAVVGVLVVRYAGRERIKSAQLVSKERAFACAEAGLQYGRRFFGMTYEASHGWNDYLDGTLPGYRYDPAPTLDGPVVTDAMITASTDQTLGRTRGAFDGSTYDPGTTYPPPPESGLPMFWVTIRDDEPPSDQNNKGKRDNNEAAVVRSQCTAFYYEDGGDRTAVVEGLLVHVQNASGYGNAQVTSNSPDILGQMGTQ